MKKPNDISPGNVRIWQALSAGLVVVNMAMAAYVVWHHDFDPVEDNPYPLIDVARNFVPQEHYLSTLQPLRERVHTVVDAEKDFRVSAYIEFLNTGSNIIINPGERFWPASLSKVPLAMAVMGTIESGVWTLDQVLTLEESDKMEVSSRIQNNPVGTKFTVRQLLEELLIHSDNTAYRILGRNVPESELTAIKEGLGLDELFDAEGKVTAREYSRIFRSLYTASYLNRENSQYLLETLDRAEWKEFLRAPVPTSIPFPHKYGIDADRRTYSDAGVVYLANRPYLITVVVEAPETVDEATALAEAKRIIQTLSNMSLEYFQNAKNREL